MADAQDSNADQQTDATDEAAIEDNKAKMREALNRKKENEHITAEGRRNTGQVHGSEVTTRAPDVPPQVRRLSRHRTGLAQRRAATAARRGVENPDPDRRLHRLQLGERLGRQRRADVGRHVADVAPGAQHLRLDVDADAATAPG